MFEFVDKRDLSPAGALTAEERRVVRDVARGSGSEADRALARSVIRRARERGLWLGCGCRREEDGRRPVVAPCRSHRGAHYWRVLGGRHARHGPGCVFHRKHAESPPEASQDRPTRKAPEGYFAVPLDWPEGLPALEARTGSGRTGKRPGAHPPALSQRLLKLMEDTELNRFRPGDEGRESCLWLAAMRERAKEDKIEIAPGRLLSNLWFPRVAMWRGRWAHAQIRKAARNWPKGQKPQGFLCWVVRKVDEHSVSVRDGKGRVEVLSGVRQPLIGGNPVSPPYLFIGVVGLPQGKSGYECLEGYAQPIVSDHRPIPVDSDYERKAFRTLRTTLRILSREFPDASFELEKPVFERDTKEGPCLPDFLIHARRGADKARFVVEVMGFDRPEYLEGKETTHPRMKELGPLYTMQASAFDSSSHGVTEEGRKVTDGILQKLEERWGGRR